LVDRVGALGVRALVPGHLDAVVDADPLEDQHAVLVLDLAAGLDVVPVLLNFDLTRFQRAGKGAGQSAGGRGDHVIERGRLGREPLRVGAVVLGHFGVHAEAHRLVCGGKVGQPLRPAESLDSHVGDVCGVAHCVRFTRRPC
jgi:hypothetical protein